MRMDDKRMWTQVNCRVEVRELLKVLSELAGVSMSKMLEALILDAAKEMLPEQTEDNIM